MGCGKWGGSTSCWAQGSQGWGWAQGCLGNHLCPSPAQPGQAQAWEQSRCGSQPAMKLKCTPTLQPCTELWVPIPEHRKAPPVGFKPGLSARWSPGGSGSRSSSHNVKHTNDLRNLICTSPAQNRLGAMYTSGRTGQGAWTHSHTLAGEWGPRVHLPHHVPLGMDARTLHPCLR